MGEKWLNSWAAAAAAAAAAKNRFVGGMVQLCNPYGDRITCLCEDYGKIQEGRQDLAIVCKTVIAKIKMVGPLQNLEINLANSAPPPLHPTGLHSLT